MTRDEIIARLKAHETEIRAEGVVHLALFGSRARGDARPDSDLDILVDFDAARDIDWKNLTGVYGRLEQATGLAISLLDRATLRPRFAARIADDLIQVF
jgi:predicted nucleotidyltransferase